MFCRAKILTNPPNRHYTQTRSRRRNCGAGRKSLMEELQQTIVLHTDCGSVRGTKEEACCRFLGVPFAKAERFCYAERVDHWDGVMDATVPGPACPQNRAWHEHLEHPTRLFYKKEFREGIAFSYDENCLNLNIYTPHDAKGCPVILFFYGGGFDSGMNTEGAFDGSGLARRGIVTVFANYRVGVLGYLTHREIQKQFGRDGNFGLDDQLTVIRWVKAHIADFGGDPNNITLMGQSAGAISIQYLCLNPNHAGLFQRAVMLSGAGLFPKFALPRAAESTHAYWEQFMELAGCKTLDELKALDLDSLFDTVEQIKAVRKDNTFCTMPVVDGVLLPAPVEELIKTPLPIDYLVSYTNTDMYAPIMAYIGNRFAQQTEGYVSFFDIDAPGDDNRAFHSSELRYVFETLDRSWRPYTERDHAVASAMADYLAAFAKAGNPNAEGLPVWAPAKRALKTPVLRLTRERIGMGHAAYGKLLRNFLTKGEPKA